MSAAAELLDQAVVAAKTAASGLEGGGDPLPYLQAREFGRLLVVDDDPEFLGYAAELGRAVPAEVATARNAAEALQRAATSPPDAAVLDVLLPTAEDGFALAAALRALPGLEALPLAFVAADDSLVHRVAATHVGARLFMAKPLERSVALDAFSQLLSSRLHAQPRVLVVDDDPDFCSWVGEILSRGGMTAHTAQDPAKVLDIASRLNPDVLLLDIEMPGHDGLSLCRAFRSDPRWQTLTILIMTVHSGADHRTAAFEAGADDYVIKPVIERELLARVGVRVERARLQRDRVDRDGLTGLLLRRPLLEGFSARLSEARRHGRSLAACILDIDRFKQVNDRWGHGAGDLVLTHLARLLRGRFREEDLRGRWGGEEFVLVFPGASAETIEAVVQRVHAEFRAHPFQGDAGEVFYCTFSAGISSFPADGRDPSELLRAADRRLYAAKAQGRARVVRSG